MRSCIWANSHWAGSGWARRPVDLLVRERSVWRHRLRDSRTSQVMHRRFAPSSTNRLTDRNLDRFPGVTLFDRIAQAVCRAGCLPRKELYEAWETARRVRRLFRGGRVVDLAAGPRRPPPGVAVLRQHAPAA